LESAMDLIVIAVIVALFGLTAGMIRLLDRL
jgi:hypothetical protein